MTIRSTVRWPPLLMACWLLTATLGARPGLAGFLTENTTTMTDERFQQVAPWSGRLILPSEDERRPDGGVAIELHNWPEGVLPASATKGGAWPQATVVWRTAPFEPRGIDVEFSEDVYAYIGGRTPAEADLNAPWRLNGWQGVRALESLAGARIEDDVEVRLEAVEVVVNEAGKVELHIGREPVQVAGTEYCLLRFHEMDGQGRLVGRHWNRETRDFSGPAQICVIPDDVPDINHAKPVLQVKHTTVDRIWQSPLNRYGWYAYGRRVGEDFLLDGLLPRRIHELKPDQATTGIAAGRRFIEEEQWDEHVLDQAQRNYYSMLIGPHEDETIDELVNVFQQEGKRFLVLHVFGAWGRHGIAEQDSLRTGHFAFGTATVVRCPFTGEARFAIEYSQVYGTNGQGIVSGRVDWAEYMGSLRRGWMQLRPVWDIVVDFPPLMEDYQWRGVTVSPARILVDELSHVMAAYRVGMGGGCAMVTVLNSCVQDSNQGLFRALESIFADESDEWAAAHRYRGLGRLRNWAERGGAMAGGPDEETARRWLAFRGWYDGTGRRRPCRSLSREFFRVAPAGMPIGRVWREDWQENLENGETMRRADHRKGMLDVLNAYKHSRNSMLPRRGQDTHAKLLLEHGARLWVINTVQVGGILDGQFARAPEKLNWNKLRQLFGSFIPGWGR